MTKGRFVSYLAAGFLFVAAAAGAAPDTGSGAAEVDPGQVQELQERMQNDPAIMALILAMQNDPEMRSLLSDPATLKALESGDLSSLINDPRFRRLLDNPAVKEIERKLR